MKTPLKFVGALVSALVIGWLVFYFWFTTFLSFFPDEWHTDVYVVIGALLLFGLVMAPIFILLRRDRLALMLFALAVAFLVFQSLYLVWYASTNEARVGLFTKASSAVHIPTPSAT